MKKPIEKKKPTKGLVYADKCLECLLECKIEVLPGAKLVKCPDFKKNPDSTA